MCFGSWNVDLLSHTSSTVQLCLDGLFQAGPTFQSEGASADSAKEFIVFS